MIAIVSTTTLTFHGLLALLLQENSTIPWNPKYVDGPIPVWQAITIILVFLIVLGVLFYSVRTCLKRLLR